MVLLQGLKQRKLQNTPRPYLDLLYNWNSETALSYLRQNLKLETYCVLILFFCYSHLSDLKEIKALLMDGLSSIN